MEVRGYSNQQNFTAIRGFKYGGAWNFNNKGMQAVEKTFLNSRFLEKYHKKNDVFVTFTTGKISLCEKNKYYATVKMEKVFEAPKTLWEKICRFFEGEPYEAVCITRYDETQEKAVDSTRIAIKYLSEGAVEAHTVKNKASVAKDYICKLKRCEHRKNK